MPVKTFPLGPLETNCHLVHNDRTAVVVDPGGAPRPVLNYLEMQGLTLTHILNTHLHFDHIYGNAALAAATGAPILASAGDAFLRDTELGKGGAFGFPPVDDFASTVIEPGEHRFGDLVCTVFATPGHTPGSLSFHFPDEDTVIVGDLIFYRSIGRTDFPGGDLDKLRASVRDHIFTLPGKTRILPGHGPATSVDDEMRNNPYFGDFAV